MFGLDDRLAAFSDGTTLLVVLGISLVLGLRHASDPDHLAAVATLVASGRERAEPRERGVRPREEEEESPAGDVEERDRTAEAGQAQPFGARQGGNDAEHRATSLSEVRGRSSRLPRQQ